MRFVVLLETARRHRVGKNKKRALASELRVQPLDQERVFVIEHRLQTLAADVAIGRSVNRIAESHVVGRHGFRDRSRRAADVKKSPRHFLPRADLRERPVFLRVEIDLERLLVRSHIHLRVHARIVAAASYRPGKRARDDEITNARVPRFAPESSLASR